MCWSRHQTPNKFGAEILTDGIAPRVGNNFVLGVCVQRGWRLWSNFRGFVHRNDNHRKVDVGPSGGCIHVTCNRGQIITMVYSL
jgi:hypothetical protein